MGEGKKHLFEKVEKMHADVAEAAPIERRLVGGGAKGGVTLSPPTAVHPTGPNLSTPEATHSPRVTFLMPRHLHT